MKASGIDRSIVRVVCGVQFYGLDAYVGLELSNKSVEYGKHCTLVWSCVEEGGGYILCGALEFEGQRKKGRSMRTWRRQIEEESVKVGLSGGCALCRSMWICGINQIAAVLR